MVTPCAAGIVNGNGFVRPLGFFGKANLLKDLPDSHIFIAGEFFSAGGAAGDHRRIIQFCHFFIQETDGVFLHFIPAGPIADGTAATQHQRHTALQAVTQIQVCRSDGSRRNRRGLAAGEEHIFAGITSRLLPAEEGLFIRKGHVHQGKFMNSQRHFSCVDHILPGHMTDFRHVIAVGAQDTALAAQAAGIDRAVHHMVAHNDRHIIVDLTGENAGEFLIMLQIGTAFNAFIAVALDAAACLGDSTFPAVTLDSACRFDAFQIGIQPGLDAALFTSGIAGIQVLGHTVGRERCFLSTERGAQDTLSLTGDELILSCHHHCFVNGKVGMEHVRHFIRRTFQIMGFCIGCSHIRIPDELNVHLLEGSHRCFLYRCRQHRNYGSNQRSIVFMLRVHRHRVHLLCQFSCQEQAEQVGPKYGALFRLLPQESFLPGHLAVLNCGCLQLPDGNTLT